MLATALTLAGFATETGVDGDQALQLVDAFAPDVAILDLGLPRMDGYELAARLRQRGQPATLVAVTGHGTGADRLGTRESGFDLHLVKPIDLNDLIAFVRGSGMRCATE